MTFCWKQDCAALSSLCDLQVCLDQWFSHCQIGGPSAKFKGGKQFIDFFSFSQQLCQIVIPTVKELFVWVEALFKSRKKWINTRLSTRRLYNFGLRQHTKASLLLELLTPTAFSIVIVIQLHFFHRPFLDMIDLRVRSSRTAYQSTARGAVEPQNEPSTSRQDGGGLAGTPREPQTSTQKSFLVMALIKMVNFYNDLTVFLWRVGELHMLKLVNLTLICVVLYQVSLAWQFCFSYCFMMCSKRNIFWNKGWIIQIKTLAFLACDSYVEVLFLPWVELKPLFALDKGPKQNCRQTHHLFEGLHCVFLSSCRVKDEKKSKKHKIQNNRVSNKPDQSQQT